jgi:hypothetical protein
LIELIGLEELIIKLELNQVARAYFGGEEWYVINHVGFIRYCNETGEEVNEIVPLTYSNIHALYEIIKD